MNRTTKKLKKLEKNLARKLDKDFNGLKDWQFYGDMSKGYLVIVVTAMEK